MRWARESVVRTPCVKITSDRVEGAATNLPRRKRRGRHSIFVHARPVVSCFFVFFIATRFKSHDVLCHGWRPLVLRLPFAGDRQPNVRARVTGRPRLDWTVIFYFFFPGRSILQNPPPFSAIIRDRAHGKSTTILLIVFDRRPHRLKA